MNSVAYSLLLMLRSSFRTRARMQIEILALRHQLAVLQRQKKRVSLSSRPFALGTAFTYLEPMALRAGSRQTGNSNCLAAKGFRLYWRWKSRAGKRGRPCVSRETRELIRQMSKANPL